MDLKEPTKKRNLFEDNIKPPLPILSGNVRSGWSVDDFISYNGTFNGLTVIIDDPEEMTSLHSKGFFGKACLSRGLPLYGKSSDGLPPILKERQWKRRLQWSKKIGVFCENVQNMPQEPSETGLQSETSDSVKNSDIIAKDSPKKNEDVEKNSENVESSAENCLKHKVDCLGSDNEASSSKKICVNDLEKDKHELDVNQASDLVDKETKFLKFTLDSFSSREGQEFLVLPDSGSETESEVGTLKPHLEIEKMSTFSEELHLSLEEAFFLSFGLGCLEVVDISSNRLSICAMWKLFQQSQPDFIDKYIAYHYFRSKGWVVKPGIKYGGDFVLYKLGPPYYHASYIVIVEAFDEQLLRKPMLGDRKLTWKFLGGMNRMAEATNKEILLCQVQWPKLSGEDIKSPNVLKKFRVNEVLLRRWQAAQEREG